jgi:hypothetical protein
MNHWGPGAEKERIERIRRMTFGEKLRRVCELNEMVRIFHAAAVRLRNPEATDRDVHREWMLFRLGEKLVNELIAAGRDIYGHLPPEPDVIVESTDGPG